MLSPHIKIQRASSDHSSARPAANQPLKLQSQQHTKRRASVARQNEVYQALLGTTPPGSRRASINSGSVRSPRTSLEPPHSQQQDSQIIIKWFPKPLDKVPELSLLSKRPTGFHAISGDCLSKFFHAIASICKAFNRVGDSALANFKPVQARTEHNLEYVNDLAREYTINIKYGSPTMSVLVRTPSGTTVKSDQSKASKSSKSSTTKRRDRAEQAIRNQILKEFYDKSYRTLSILQETTSCFKTIIYNLTFSRYAEEDLTEIEARMVRGKSIIGSCIWVVTLALQQLQDDPEVEHYENFVKEGNPALVEIGVEMASLIGLSLHIWHDILSAIGILEKLHRRTEDIFQKQTDLFVNIHTKFKPNAEAVNWIHRHSRQYRRPLRYDIEELKNSKTFDPYASLLTWSSKKGHSPARILYLTEYMDPNSLWSGFDTLSVEKKITYMKDILNFIKLVLESVKENIQKIIAELNGHTRAPDTLMPTANRNYNFTGISSYEEGLDAMDEILTKKLTNLGWNFDETREAFEADKIFLDDMDVLTLSAALTRTIVFEMRHIMHVCYETCRFLSYKEFSNLPSYERIFQKVKESYANEFPQSTPPARTGLVYRRQSIVPARTLSNAHFDTEESHFQLRNVAGLFRTSPYRDILKNLPIYTNRIGVTLQDAELVFTPSSEKLLS